MDTSPQGTPPVGVDLLDYQDEDIPDDLPQPEDFDDGSGPITGDEEEPPEEDEPEEGRPVEEPVT